MSATTEATQTFNATGTSVHADDIGLVASQSRMSRLRARATIARIHSSQAASRAYTRSTRWFKEHVTIPGYLAIAVAILGVSFGLIFGIIEWLLPGLAALFMLILASFFLFGGNSYDVDLGILENHVVAGESVEGTITITNTSRRPVLPGALEIPVGDSVIDVAVPFLRAQHSSEQTIAIPGHKRGVVEIGPIRSIRTDPVGLLRRELHWTNKYTLYVHPLTVNLPVSARGFVRDLEGTPSQHLVTDDISFHAIREYMPGDSQRNIHWKTTAKTGKLMVRQFEETRKSMVGVLLTLSETEYYDEEEFEVAVSAAASLSARFIRDHQDIEVLVSNDVPMRARSVFASAHRLATHTPIACLNDFTTIDHGENMMILNDIAGICSRNIPDLSNIFLITGSRPSLQSLQKTASVFPVDAAVTVIRVDLQARPRLQFISGIPYVTLGAIDDLRYLMSRMVQA